MLAMFSKLAVCGLTLAFDMIRLDEATDLHIRPPRWNLGLDTCLFLLLVVLIWILCLFLRADAFDPCFGDLLVGQLLHALDSVEQESRDSLSVVDSERLGWSLCGRLRLVLDYRRGLAVTN